jgi:spore germination cell wall hydrolase CwlJ-like protein
MAAALRRIDGWRERPGRWVAAIALLTLAGAAFSAKASRISAVSAPAAITPTIAPNSFEADDHFPGAALLYAELPPPPVQASTPGATGTTALPDTPVPANFVDDATVRPAAPFVLKGGEVDRARALQCLTTAIYYEAANEPDDGQAAVAQVILNRVRHPAFPASVCGVVFQGSERPVCQFSFACDGAMARVPMRAAWERARRAAARALAGHVFAPVGLATHYHTYAVTPSWNRTLVMTGVFGAHFFHRWKGWWGTAGAFRQAHSGVEPVPGPHVRHRRRRAAQDRASGADAGGEHHARASRQRHAPPAICRKQPARVHDPRPLEGLGQAAPVISGTGGPADRCARSAPAPTARRTGG